jgi:hypothetical protein
VLVENGPHPVRIHRLLQRCRLGILPGLDVGQITPQLLLQVDELRGLLPGQERRLQVQMRPLLREPGEPSLVAQNHRGGQQRAQTGNPLQPEERRRVGLRHSKLAQHDVHEHPERDEEKNEAEKHRLLDESADLLVDPLRAADLLILTRLGALAR